MGNFFKTQNNLYAKTFNSKVIKTENFINNDLNKLNLKMKSLNFNNTSKFLKNYLTADVISYKNIINTKNISKKKISNFFQNFKNKPGYIQTYLHLKNRYNID